MRKINISLLKKLILLIKIILIINIKFIITSYNLNLKCYVKGNLIMYKIIVYFFGLALLYASAKASCEYLEQRQERGVPFALMFGMGLGVANAPGVGDKTYTSKNELLIEVGRNALCKGCHRS